MKTDLLTAIVTAIVGVLIAFFATNFLLGPIESVTYTTVDSTVNTTISEPNPEVFNYRALNPTVEVYVGECSEYNEFDKCVEVQDSQNETPSPETTNQETE